MKTITLPEARYDLLIATLETAAEEMDDAIYDPFSDAEAVAETRRQQEDIRRLIAEIKQEAGEA